jgi:hypothetical protein
MLLPIHDCEPRPQILVNFGDANPFFDVAPKASGQAAMDKKVVKQFRCMFAKRHNPQFGHPLFPK